MRGGGVEGKVGEVGRPALRRLDGWGGAPVEGVATAAHLLVPVIVSTTHHRIAPAHLQPSDTLTERGLCPMRPSAQSPCIAALRTLLSYATLRPSSS